MPSLNCVTFMSAYCKIGSEKEFETIMLYKSDKDLIVEQLTKLQYLPVFELTKSLRPLLLVFRN